ncbi:DUF4062 domain-containing protein [Microbulbifer echini]|uniref:DUF4062 domain-containing protein n=1 Tax=Microbulbifer echini TaxID=1529067 RepID=A0ABV4NKX1_9GAMM
MAVPRVFISSTCYDLSEVRDRLVSFSESFGFETSLSERGDVFYHPDLHTHESCINEISNCQLFILIIGGRFGGKHKIDPDKSITNAEFIAAKELGIPVFTFVKEGVLSDHNFYQKNKSKDFAEEITYPSIENQDHAKNIFNFIDQVRLSDTNNGFFGFTYAKDIEVYLRKQLAGMFFGFLSERNIGSQLKSTNDAVSNLTVASRKIEELVKTIYRQVDTAHADNVISTIEDISSAKEFFDYISDKIEVDKFIPAFAVESLVSFASGSWVDFILSLESFSYIHDIQDKDGRTTDALGYKPSKRLVADIDGDLTNSELQVISNMEEKFSSYIRLSIEDKREIIMAYVKSLNK